MTRRASYLLKILSRPVRDIRIVQRYAVKTDDRVHRRPYLMAHVGEESSLGFARFLSDHQSLSERSGLIHLLSHFLIYISEGRADHMDHAFITVIFSDAGQSQHLIRFYAVPDHYVSVCDDLVFFKTLPDVLRIEEAVESFSVLFRNESVDIFSERLKIREHVAFLRQALDLLGRPVAYALILVKIDIEHAPVVRSHRSDHPVEAGTLALLVQKFVLQSEPLLHLFLAGSGLRAAPRLSDQVNKTEQKSQYDEQHLDQAPHRKAS